ncbi:hypothetical protein BDI4_1880020 [Burkholderia diffusa]|nr:hypothetical protein BDI4_1880020 [Burkholderia diffusa]
MSIGFPLTINKMTCLYPYHSNSEFSLCSLHQPGE